MMELSNVLFSAKYWTRFNLDGQGNMTEKNVDSDAKYQYKRKISNFGVEITKETLIPKLCCSCVRLLVHRFIFSVLLGKYS